MSVTAVPIRPLGKGSLAKLWIGLALLVIAAAALAWFGTGGQNYTTTASGLQYRVIEKGEGPSPAPTSVIQMDYTGRLADGTEFETTVGKEPAVGIAGQFVPGFSEALLMMNKGATYRVRIPPELGYGAEERRDPRTNQVVIPANSTLEFDITLRDFRTLTPQEIQQIQMMQQMQQQGGQPGAQQPGAEPQPGAGQ